MVVTQISGGLREVLIEVSKCIWSLVWKSWEMLTDYLGIIFNKKN